MIRAAKLEVDLYEEVEHDLGATGQALLVVVIVAVVSGIGAALAGGGAGGAMGGLIFGIIRALVGWAVWSLLMYWIGTAFFRGKATYGELLRCVGFAYVPSSLSFFVFIPVLGGLLALAGAIWALIAMIIAVRQALDVSTGKAIITAIIGWVIIWVATGILAALGILGGLATGGIAPL
jgi:hypothetical protein